MRLSGASMGFHRELLGGRGKEPYMSYEHTQSSPFRWIFLALSAVCICAAWIVSKNIVATLSYVCVAFVFTFAALCFGSLTVRDEGASLSVRFGPLPVFGTRVSYDTVVTVEAVRSHPLEGLGIHWIPGRGWIYNVWGLDCVQMQMNDKVVRIGTDDRNGLLRLLKTKIRGTS
jgi:hypothetical protein